MPFLLGMLAAVGVFVAYVATRPSAFRIARSLTIPASPAVVHGLINDFHEWARWSPYEKYDAAMTKTYEGPSSGVGASYRWSGNNKVGEGSMTITESGPERVVIDLRFVKPFTASNTATFTIEPAGDSTKVTWAMTGENAFGAKAFGVFVNMDELVGKDFVAGLEAMKTAAAAQA